MKVASIFLSVTMAQKWIKDSKRDELQQFCERASNTEQYLKVMNRGSNLQELKNMLERQQTLKDLNFNAKMADETDLPAPSKLPSYKSGRISRETTQGTTTVTPPEVTSQLVKHYDYYESNDENNVLHDYHIQHDAVDSFIDSTTEQMEYYVQEVTTEEYSTKALQSITEILQHGSDSNVRLIPNHTVFKFLLLKDMPTTRAPTLSPKQAHKTRQQVFKLERERCRQVYENKSEVQKCIKNVNKPAKPTKEPKGRKTRHVNDEYGHSARKFY